MREGFPSWLGLYLRGAKIIPGRYFSQKELRVTISLSLVLWILSADAISYVRCQYFFTRSTRTLISASLAPLICRFSQNALFYNQNFLINSRIQLFSKQKHHKMQNWKLDTLVFSFCLIIISDQMPSSQTVRNSRSSISWRLMIALITSDFFYETSVSSFFFSTECIS